ncbi:unnamed protein product [Lactuca virosa]|uniref:Sulfhydryl oxidase n=1 Tax=Lactuca virosa TaxID=75947 RepID=A0AAU9PGU1_9ASTR|nr:unnamed protein product [Lactuca virosa]
MSLFEATRTPKRNNRRIPSCSSITWRLSYFIIIPSPVYFYTPNLHWCPACRNYKIARAVYDVEEATSLAFDIILENKMIKPDTRATLIKFMQLMIAHHPSKRRRRGSADILVNFDDLYPSNILSPFEKNNTQHGGLTKFEIRGKEVPRGYWMFCRGSKNGTRGFSCGLWVLLHSLSVRVENEESQMTFTSICDFIHKFFACEECSQHFYNMCSRFPDAVVTLRSENLTVETLVRCPPCIGFKLWNHSSSMSSSSSRFQMVSRFVIRRRR